MLKSEGVKTAMPETIESSFILGQDVLESMGVSPYTVDKMLEKMRDADYKLLEKTTEQK